MVGLVPFSAGESLLVCRDVTERVRVDRIRRDFLSNVSHELRTPITVLGGYLEMLQEAADELPERWRRPVDAMREQTVRMRISSRTCFSCPGWSRSNGPRPARRWTSICWSRRCTKSRRR